MKSSLQKILVKIHFIALLIAITNSIVKNFTANSLEANVEISINLLIAISGLVLCFFYLKPFSRKTIYYSIYALTAFLLVIGLVFRGMFLGFILSIILSPIVPDKKEFEQNGIVVTIPYQGFMSRCCSYQVKERKLLIFEQDHGIIESEMPIQFKKIEINSTTNEIEVTYTTGDESNEVVKKMHKISR